LISQHLIILCYLFFACAQALGHILSKLFTENAQVGINSLRGVMEEFSQAEIIRPKAFSEGSGC